QPLNHVVSRLLLPLPLSLLGRSILRLRAFVLHGGVHPHLGQFAVLRAILLVITPDPGLGLEGHLVFRAFAEIAFLAVNVSRYPVARDQVQAPAIHVKEVSAAETRFISAIEAHNVVILVFYPNLAVKAAIACALFGGDLEDYTADITQELAAHVLEVISLAIKVVAVSIDHPGEAQGLVFELKQSGEAAQKAALKAGVFGKIVTAVHFFAQIHAAEEVMVLRRRRALLRTKLQVLQIGLNERSAGLQHFYERVLALDRAIHHLVHRGGRWRGECGTSGC